MNNNILLWTALFVIIAGCTSWFWLQIPILGFLMKPALFFLFAFLVVADGYYLLKLFIQKFKDQAHINRVFILSALLVLTFFIPYHKIDFSRLEGKDLIVVTRTGTVNCITNLKLKEGQRFLEESWCFGLTIKRGEYQISSDTVRFIYDNPENENERLVTGVFTRPKSAIDKTPTQLEFYHPGANGRAITMFVKQYEVK